MLSEPILKNSSCVHIFASEPQVEPSHMFRIILDLCPDPVNFFWLGKQPFQFIWDVQKLIHTARIEGQINDVVLLLEHHPVYTFGKNANKDHLLPSYRKDADVISIDRGGDITFHGPGQMVVYPILNLRGYRTSVSWYMRSLEEVVIRTLRTFGVFSQTREGMTGVWIDDEKICAMGVRLSRWVSMHGLALNLNTDLDYFTGIIPCGIFECGVTSLEKQTDQKISMSILVETFIQEFRTVFQPTPMKPEVM